MDYINTALVVSTAQGVPKRPLEKKQFTSHTKRIYPMPKHDRGLDHHMCSPKTKIAFLAFNHHNE